MAVTSHMVSISTWMKTCDVCKVVWMITKYTDAYMRHWGKANPGYSRPDENLDDMNMYVCLWPHFTHATQINIFGKYITINQQSNLTRATGHVVVAANTGTTAGVPYPSATRIGHPQIPIRGSRPRSGPSKRGRDQRHRDSSTREDRQPPCPAGMQQSKRIEIEQCNWDQGEL